MAFTGTVARLPLGELGLTGSQALSRVPPQALLLATNVSWDQGNIRKEGGATKYNTTAVGSGAGILAGWDWWPTDATQRVIVYTNTGMLSKDDGSGTFPTTLKSGLSGSGYPVFAEGGKEALATPRKLFMCNGLDPVQVLSGDGTTTAIPTGAPADWSGTQQPVCMAEHDGRMWGALGHRVYFSTADNHEDFTDTLEAGSIAVGAGTGEKIVQIMSYKGLLLVWKYPVGIYYVDTTDPVIANWGVRRLSTTVGGVSPQGAVQVSDDVLFLDQSGNFQLLSGIQEYGSIGLKNLSQLNKFATYFRENVALSQLYKVRGVFYAHKLEAHFAIAKLGQSENTARIVIDFNEVAQARFRWSDRDTCPALWMWKDTDLIQRPLIGGTDGFIWKLDRDIFTKGDTGYQAILQTPHMDFAWLDPELAVRRKNGQFLELVCDATGSWDLSCDVYWDGTYTQTVDFTTTVAGLVLGSWALASGSLGGSSTVAVRKRVVGSGKRVSFKFYNSDTSSDFNLSEVHFSFGVADERNI